MNVSLPRFESPPLSRRLAVCLLLGALAACGSPDPGGPAVPGVMATSSALSVSPEIPLYAIPYGTQSQSRPIVTAGNGIYLVVWKELLGGQQQPVLQGVRVRASDGVLLDSAAISVRIPPYTLFTPLEDFAVAFDGTNFLVVYSEYRHSNISAYMRVLGTRIRASDGAVLPDAGFLVSAGTRETARPAVTFDGQNYLVTWEGWTIPQNGGTAARLLHGAWVRPSGALVHASAFPIAPNGVNAQLATGGNTAMAIWSEGFSGPLWISRFISEVPQPVASLPVAGTGGSPAFAFDGANFLVVWNEGSALKGKRVSKEQWRVLDATAFPVATEVATGASVHFDTGRFRVTYEGARGGAGQVLTRRVTGSGEVGAEQVLSDLHASAGTETPSAASVGADQNLVAYRQFDASVNQARIRVRRFSDPQEEACNLGGPTLTVNGGTELTLECGSGTYTDLGAQAVDGCGNPVAVHAYNTGADASGPGPNLGAEGTYAVSYAAWNASGDVSVTRTVHVKDRTAPVLVLKGAAHQTHTCGSQWEDPGVEATDACYGNLAATVWHTGEVNGWAEGTYTVTYTLTDSGGNSATPVTRTVDVVNCPW
ncbi:protein of unknown function [Stigmatella aurantiaca]|uniref:Pesticidal crystal protein Cry22Aa Ig-like domain-containing protein n=2 Tax=Stigmatella aurantiaca TaxID=41 RepID=A0A1H7V0Z3_STIAU|nr:protein of unknown function [Stigmatella aurantiaca]